MAVGYILKVPPPFPLPLSEKFAEVIKFGWLEIIVSQHFCRLVVLIIDYCRLVGYAIIGLLLHLVHN